MSCLISKKILNLIYFLIIIKGFTAASDHTWNFEFKEITCKTSNKDLLDFRLKNERVSRGNYALSGDFYLNVDILEGDSNEIAMKIFRSQNNDGDYKEMPYDIPRDHFFKVVNNQYKNSIMESLHECSDMPYFSTEIERPIEKKTYTLNKCKISQDGLPNFLEVGTYKIVVSGYGDVEWEIVAIVEVEQN